MEDRISGPTGQSVRLETIDCGDSQVTVAWPDIDDAANLPNTEIMVWSNRSHAEIVYRRLLTTGSMKPRGFIYRVILAALVIAAAAVWLPLWGALLVGALALLMLMVSWLVKGRTYQPLIQGKGKPNLVVDYLRSAGTTFAVGVVREYLEESRVAKRAEMVRAMSVHAKKR